MSDSFESVPRNVGLRESDLLADPIEQVRRWVMSAVQAGNPEPYAMTLATATADGMPSARMVLLRGIEAKGFSFFTHYRSRKGRELEQNPRAALVFHWPELDRQVRIEGTVERLPAEDSDAYFRSRSFGSRLSAIASPQSEVIPDRDALEGRVRALITEHRHRPALIPRPEHWGGYRVVPRSIEFWQSGLHRMHDRLRYRLDDGVWRIERLAP